MVNITRKSENDGVSEAVFEKNYSVSGRFFDRVQWIQAYISRAFFDLSRGNNVVHENI